MLQEWLRRDDFAYRGIAAPAIQVSHRNMQKIDIQKKTVFNASIE